MRSALAATSRCSLTARRSETGIPVWRIFSTSSASSLRTPLEIHRGESQNDFAKFFDGNDRLGRLGGGFEFPSRVEHIAESVAGDVVDADAEQEAIDRAR